MALTFNADDFEAINHYFMQQVQIKTPAAEKIKQEWMRWWKDNKRSIWTSYTQEEFDTVRNMRNRFNLANTKTPQEKAMVANAIKTGFTAEEAHGETRRAGTEGMYLEEEEPLIPTKWKVAGAIGIGLITVGVFGKKLLAMTPAAKLVKYLP